MTILWIIGFILFIIIIWIISTYNSFVSLRNRVKDQWAQIDVQLKRRADLIPNLVETIKGYAKHEKSTLEDVVKARNTFVTAKTTEEEINASSELTNCLSKLMMLAESYPELKANENFLGLQNSLKETEDKISTMRQFYNDIVMKYNNKVQVIPSNIIAKIFGFNEEAYFKIVEEERNVPKVSFE